MGVYDTKVNPFAQLTKETKTTKKDIALEKNKELLQEAIKKAKVPKNMAEDVTICVEHISSSRMKYLSSSSGLRKGGSLYVRTVWSILSGNNSFEEALTVPQFCDLYDFAITHRFWVQYIKTPEGLKRNLLKLWDGAEFQEWSLKNKKPAENRPKKTTDEGQKYSTHSFRGQIVADINHDYDHDYIAPEWDEE